MEKLLQVIYISRSTFKSQETINKIEPNIARILAKSRINNRLNGLVGVLYFGDSVFFQCLEGDEKAVNTLLMKLEVDNRHKDLKIISRKYIDKLSFGDWAMKFAPLDDQIKQFLKEYNFETFDPYLFSDEIINKFLSLLFNTHDDSSELELPASSNSSVNHELGIVSTLNSLRIKSNFSLTFSVVALVISLVTFLSSHSLI